MTENPQLVVLNLIGLSIIAFTCHLLLLRNEYRDIRSPLILTLLATGVVICYPVVAFVLPAGQIPVLILSLPAWMLIPTGLYGYTQALTQTQPWQFRSLHWRHWLLPATGLAIALTTLALPAEITTAIFSTGDDAILASIAQPIRGLAYTLLTGTFILIMLWVGLSAAYLIAILRRLSRYRRQLKDHFANTEGKELGWLSTLVITLLSLWLLSAITLLVDNLWFPFSFAPWLKGGVTLAFIWTLAAWGLRQQPGLAETGEITPSASAQHHQSPDIPSANAPSTDETKYLRSGLTEGDITRIAAKIQHALQNDKVYLDPGLSLRKLARHINTSPNYISQTLNQQLKMNFFDYVNHHRVEAAKHRLQNSNDTVLDIAMAVGFNAKSSFYTAFKKECGQTPSEFRKQH